MMTSPRPSMVTRGGLRAVQVIEPFVDPIPDEALEGLLQAPLQCVTHRATSRITLPA
jgi:hypothetical protein